MTYWIARIAIVMFSLTLPAAGRAAALPENASVDQALDALHEVGVNLKGFTAEVRLSEVDPLSGDEFSRPGRVWYQSLGEGASRMRVVFDQKEQGGKILPQKIEYKLENGWLIDRDYRRKLEVNRQVLRPGEKINLLKLGEGPFPLPIGQPRDEVKKLFEVASGKPIDGETPPSDTVHIALAPRPGTPFAKKFAVIDVWVDRPGHMPRRIEVVEKSGTIRTTDLTNVRLNPSMSDDDFKLPAIDKEWTRHDEPYAGE